MSLAEILVVTLLSAMLGVGLIALVRRPEPAPQAGLDPAALLADWDRRVRDMPQHADLRTISDRLATVERVCDVVRAEMSGVKEAIGRIERQTNILIDHQIDRRA